MSNSGSLEELARIRGLMDRSTRFLSLSGLSGVFAGGVALVGAVLARAHYRSLGWEDRVDRFRSDAYTLTDRLSDSAYFEHLRFLILDAVGVLTLALLGAAWFTYRRSRSTGQGMWDPSAQRLLINLLIPLGAGGMFCLALLWHNDAFLVAPATLLFYGLALLNASKYTLDEIRWLGLSEVVLGILACFWTGAGLLFWAIGFGVLHIVYGTLMYLRHERV